LVEKKIERTLGEFARELKLSKGVVQRPGIGVEGQKGSKANFFNFGACEPKKVGDSGIM